MHNFHDSYGALPAANSQTADGKPLLSWRVHILPFIECVDLYEQFHLDEPWDSEQRLRGVWAHKILLAMCDATIRTIGDQVSDAQLRPALSTDDGQAVDWDAMDVKVGEDKK